MQIGQELFMERVEKSDLSWKDVLLYGSETFLVVEWCYLKMLYKQSAQIVYIR